MSFALQKFSATIVVAGAFNPAIFSPDWLAQFNLIGPDDAKAARESENMLLSHQVTNFETDWFGLQVLENRLTLTSRGVAGPPLRDFVVGALMLLPHTPVNAVGFNFSGVFKAETLDEWHRLGDVLAPKDVWQQIYSGETYHAGLASLTIKVQAGVRGKEAENADEKNITIAPDKQNQGVVVLSMNDHRGRPAELDAAHTTAEYFSDLVKVEWEKAKDSAASEFEQLLKVALK